VEATDVVAVGLDMSGSYLGRSTETIAESLLDSPRSVFSSETKAASSENSSPLNIFEQNY